MGARQGSGAPRRPPSAHLWVFQQDVAQHEVQADLCHLSELRRAVGQVGPGAQAVQQVAHTFKELPHNTQQPSPRGPSKVRVGLTDSQGHAQTPVGTHPGLHTATTIPSPPAQDCTHVHRTPADSVHELTGPPLSPLTFSLHSSWLPWPSEHRKSCSRRSSQSTCRVRLAKPPAGASLMSLRADSSIISRRLGTGERLRYLPAACLPQLPARPTGLGRDTPHLRLMQSGGRTSVAEAPSWVSTEKTWPRSRQAASSLSSTPRHVTRNSMLVSRLHSSSSGGCCGPRWVVRGVGRGQRVQADRVLSQSAPLAHRS